MRRSCLLLTVSLLVLAGCATAPREETRSVKPGINDAYRDADVTQWVERFEREGREVFEQRGTIVAESGLRRGQDVADIGAGTGLFVPLLADAVGPMGSVLAVDIVPEFIEHIEADARREGRTNVHAVLCSERSVELPAHSIDVAFTCDTYHHFEYPAATLASIHRALRPGGILAVVDFERIDGVSSAWILDHVRAGKEIVIEEITDAGFELDSEWDGLRDNYMLRFRRRP